MSYKAFIIGYRSRILYIGRFSEFQIIHCLLYIKFIDGNHVDCCLLSMLRRIQLMQ